MRGYLRRFLFTDERISTQVKYLSGGERSRLLLARILKNGGNFLILDELTAQLTAEKARLAKLFERWEELDAIRGDNQPT